MKISTPFPSFTGLQQKRLADCRVLSAAEFLLGSFIVIGYNVLRILPNEVLILTALGLLSARLRNGGLAVLGFKRPVSWARILQVALLAATVRIVLGEYGVVPIAQVFWPPPTLPAGADEITGNLQVAALYLLLVWTFAAFGEEIAYRGYLVLRAADVGKGSPAAYLVGVLLVSVLFGYGHYYKGPAGVLDSGFAGLILGAAYLLTSRNLWTSILAHGFIDTFGIVVLFFGWADSGY